MRLHILENKQLNRLLSRERQSKQPDENTPALDLILKEVLKKANQFVPSEAGSILLDDPIRKKGDPTFQELVFVACFGAGSSNLPGMELPVNSGIAGRSYLSAQPYLFKDIHEDKSFVAKREQVSRFKTRSIICAPIIIESSVCGVIEMINRKDKKNFTQKELHLLEIFAGYTSTLIQNVLFARTHLEISKQDGLTGLFNDRYFYVKLDQDIRQAKKNRELDLILLFADLDHFKEVNDTFGHLCGSRVLQDVAQILKETVPPQGATIARYGGDEFIIIFSEANLAAAKQVAHAICAAINKFEVLSRPYLPEDGPKDFNAKLTCSIGLSSLKSHIGYTRSLAETRQLLIKKADTAMYSAKTSGKDKVCIASPEPSEVVDSP